MSRGWTDRLLGIVLGLVIGLGVLAYFVFAHSEGTIDAPKVNGGAAGGTASAPGQAGTGPSPAAPAGGTGAAGSLGGAGNAGSAGTRAPAARPVPVVKVIGGAPPADSGPRQLSFRQGELVRFEIETDEPFSFEIRGLGIARSIEGSAVISFKATEAGQFPVIATATSIGVADLQIKPQR